MQTPSYFAYFSFFFLFVNLTPYAQWTQVGQDLDGKNDFFRTISYGVLEIQVSIYNRWGELVYSEDSNTRMQGWDGNYKGNRAPIGVYTYKARVTYVSNDNEILKGSFTLFR